MKRFGSLLKYLLLALALLPWALEFLPEISPQPWWGWQVDPIGMFAASTIILLVVLLVEMLTKSRWRQLAMQRQEQLSTSQTKCDELQEQMRQQAVAFKDTLAQERNVVRARAAELQLQQEEHRRQHERAEWDLLERGKKIAAQESWIAERDKRLNEQLQNLETERASYEESFKQQRLALESQQQEIDRQSRQLAENERQREAEVVIRLARLRESEEALAEEKMLFEQTCLAWTNQKAEADFTFRKERSDFARKVEELAEEMQCTREDLAAKEQWIESQKEQLVERRSQWEATRREETVKLEARAHELKELAWHLKQQQERQAQDLHAEGASANGANRVFATPTFANREPLQRERDIPLSSPRLDVGDNLGNGSGDGSTTSASQDEPPVEDVTASSASEQDLIEQSLERPSEDPQDDLAGSEDATNDQGTDAEEKQRGEKPVIAHRLRKLGKKRHDRARGVYRSRKPR